MAMAPQPYDDGGNGGYRPLAEINVTPLVDVMLVLLIIFMVAAPLLISGVTLELPRAASEPLPESEDRLVISVTDAKDVFIGDERVGWDALPARLETIHVDKAGTTVFVRGDRKSDYGTIMELLSVVGKAGFADISLLTEEPQEP